MVRTFPEVVRVDVSAEQIELARQAVSDSPAASAFHVSEGSRIPLPDHAVGSVFSVNVFQHLQQRVAEALTKEVARVLAPGGSAMLHVPIAGSNLTTTYGRVVVGRAVDPVRAAAHRLRHRLGGLPPMRRRVYDTVQVIGLLERVGLVDVEMSLFRATPGTVMYHSFFFARKPT